MNEEVTKQPEILVRLELLKEKVIQLETKLYPVSFSLPKEVVSNDKNGSQVMSMINNIIERVSDIKDSLDIN